MVAVDNVVVAIASVAAEIKIVWMVKLKEFFDEHRFYRLRSWNMELPPPTPIVQSVGHRRPK